MREQLKYNLSFSIKSKQSYFLKKSKQSYCNLPRQNSILICHLQLSCLRKYGPAYKQLLFKAKVTLIIINKNINLYCGTCS